MALYQIRKYLKDKERSKIFDMAENLSQEWVWFLLEKIQALKGLKIKWPEDCEDIWIGTVDGTHSETHKFKHPEFLLDKAYFSHKHGGPGITYELGILLCHQQLIWMNGGFKAGNNDVQIFSQGGLKEKLEASGKRMIGDRGYQGHQAVISTPNDASDSRPVCKLKSCALKCHEKFNGYTKCYELIKRSVRQSIFILVL